jgi:hypothetical protein
MYILDGVRPSGAVGWVSPVALVVTPAAVGAGHWAAGRRKRALAAWVAAAGFGLVAWGLGTEAPTGAAVREEMQRRLRDLMRRRGIQAPAAAGTHTYDPPPVVRLFERVSPVASPIVGIVIGVRWGLRHPRRLTVFAIALAAPDAAFYGLRAVRAVQRGRPRTAVGSALIIAGSVARLRAAAAEPLR